MRRVKSNLVCFASAVGRAAHHPPQSWYLEATGMRATVLRSPCAAAVIVTTALEDACAAKEVVWLAGGEDVAKVRVHESKNPPPSGRTIDVKV